MDGQKRMILGWSLVASTGFAAALVAPGACLGQQASNSRTVRASASSIPSPIPPSRSDPAVERSHFNERYASPQQQAPPAPSKPQPSYAPPAAAPPASYAPAYPNYAPPQAGFAPAQPGVAPQYMMVPVMAPPVAAPPAAAPAGNFFLPAAAPMMAPAAPGYAMPMAPMAPAFAMPMAPAPPQPAAFGTGMALGGSSVSVSVPTSSSTSSVEIRGPGIFSAALARVGERMVQLGRTRVRTVQETVLQTPQSQPMGGTATIATAGLTPIQPPAAPPQPPQQYAPPEQEAPPETPVPSPQGAHAHPKSKVHRLFGHE
ncbi:hypothetical protein [Planctomyces sp. SH-PL62]|uniref:hypothetical protein n=1 Tax=Planctomyces sp. SH-PL62 TaxID=1636152 RepID=UPI00078B964B|nr:hypothetical protein [Planctomyces sp. SH-PL62]AMV40837.1 hypothetical protein VT85_25615 [Planctomyces sp. SH-PL62]